jgi:hypothetical protein
MTIAFDSVLKLTVTRTRGRRTIGSMSYTANGSRPKPKPHDTRRHAHRTFPRSALKTQSTPNTTSGGAPPNREPYPIFPSACRSALQAGNLPIGKINAGRQRASDEAMEGGRECRIVLLHLFHGRA